MSNSTTFPRKGLSAVSTLLTATSAGVIALAADEPGVALVGVVAAGVLVFALSGAAGCFSLLAAFAVLDSSLDSSGLRAQPAIKTDDTNKKAIINFNRPARGAL